MFTNQLVYPNNFTNLPISRSYYPT